MNAPAPRQTLGVSLDLSKTRTGFCIWLGSKPVLTRSIQYSHCKTLGALMDEWDHTIQVHFPEMIKAAARDANQIAHYQNSNVNYEIDWVAYEDVRPINKVHMEQHFGMLGLLHLHIHYLPAYIIPVTSNEAKLALSGYGRATKEQQVDAAKRAFPHLTINNHDEADAISIGLHAYQAFTPKD